MTHHLDIERSLESFGSGPQPAPAPRTDSRRERPAAHARRRFPDRPDADYRDDYRIVSLLEFVLLLGLCIGLAIGCMVAISRMVPAEPLLVIAVSSCLGTGLGILAGTPLGVWLQPPEDTR
jgi:hypothetical protein